MCGIAGIINKTPRNFDYSAFCTLGIANDSRGGDSCGIFIDGNYEYGVLDKKLFSSFFVESDLLNETTKSCIALLHCRKASVGAISVETAQPVILNNAAGRPEFVVIHNGTIYNYEALAKKYIPDIDIKGLTDSQVMARIFYHKGYEVLNEYNGGSVFVIVDYREIEPRVFLFKGASRKNEFAQTETEERPLYYCVDPIKKELLFSSVGIYLLALRRNLSVYSLRENYLWEFKGKGFIPVEKIDRSKMTQEKEFVTKSKYYYQGEVWSSDYITINNLTNSYTFKGNPLFGKYHLTTYGRVENVPSKSIKTYEAWFYNGIALKNEHCYNFLLAFRKELNIEVDVFATKFQNLIRFLSIDGVYKLNNTWVKATSPTGAELFSGVLINIGSSAKHNYQNGKSTSDVYGGQMVPIEELFPKNVELNFKAIKEECKQLMKSQAE